MQMLVINGVMGIRGLGFAARLAVAASLLLAPVRGLAPAYGADQGDEKAVPAAEVLTAAQWQEDLDQLAVELPKRHKNAFFKVKRAEFEAMVAKFRSEIPTLEQPAVVLGFNRTAAMLGDAHTSVDTSAFTQKFHGYAFACAPCADGLVIAAAPEDHPEMNGCELVAMDGMPVAEVIDRVATFYAWENQATKLGWLRNWLNVAEALQAAGVTKSAEKVEVSFRPLAAGSQTQTVTLAAAKRDELKVKQLDRPLVGLAKVSRRQESRAMWFDMLPGSETMYLRYDRCNNDKQFTIAQYAKSVEDRLDKGGISRLIIDLRVNGGGDSALLNPFIDHLAARKPFQERGTVIVLTGRNTFSSAQLNADRLRRACKAVVIGGPTGQKPNAYGEIRNFKLKNSGLAVWYSTKYFQTDSKDPESMMPDVAVDPTMAEWVSGRDVVLEAAAAFQAN